jgi:hypothetical protein
MNEKVLEIRKEKKKESGLPLQTKQYICLEQDACGCNVSVIVGQSACGTTVRGVRACSQWRGVKLGGIGTQCVVLVKLSESKQSR